MATQVEIHYDRREKEVKIYANDEKVTGLLYLKGKSISEWFPPVETGRVLWKGFPLELKGILGTDELTFEFISDEESKKIFYDCMKDHGIHLGSPTNDENSENVETVTNTTDNSAEKYYQTAVSYKEKNIEEAQKYFALSAEQGHSYAQFELGMCYFYKDGSDEEKNKAFALFEKSAQQGCVEAITMYGFCYEIGLGVNENEDKAFELYKKAADENDADGTYYLGCCYEDGIGTEENPEKAFALYEKALSLGSVFALDNIGSAYDFGVGVEKDEKKAFEYYQLSANEGIGSGQGSLGNCYFYGNGTEIDYEEAFKWYVKAAEKKNSVGFFGTGLCYMTGKGVEKNSTLAFENLKKAAEIGDLKAASLLGDLYFFGDGVEEDEEKALEWYKFSAEKGESTGQYSLGECYYYGNGVKEDRDMAIFWYTAAAEQDDEDAILSLCFWYQFEDKNEEKLLLYKEKADNLNLSPSKYICFVNYKKEISTLAGQEQIKNFRLFGKRAFLGDEFAQTALAVAYVESAEISPNKKKSNANLKELAEAGNDIAQFYYGLSFLWIDAKEHDAMKTDIPILDIAFSPVRGWSLIGQDVMKFVGLKDDYYKIGVEWLKKSAQQGNEDAIEQLEHLKIK